MVSTTLATQLTACYPSLYGFLCSYLYHLPVDHYDTGMSQI